ncbi:MAG: thermonuclease family protein [Nitrospirae bacterium]|uniref:thermonuclease family protein n=1 Tax=Candidatus Magnetobacterium casense TaxID=1455061 RepID=UPI0006978744|nr:thermonuclease family protein [Candidatus Magnetobacterium casensis]MBF0337864.1 thermonuclease family protein [Nitrospirota bacterium]
MASLVTLVLLSLSYNRCNLPEKVSPKKQYNREKVVRVKDGDTVVLSPGPGRQSYTCWLYGIDSPETPKRNVAGQPYATEAAKALEQLILGKEVEVTLTDDKTYNREVCVLRLSDKDINLRMIELGYAWAYKHYLKAPYTESYLKAQQHAMAARAGLWQDNKPQPPWEFRARSKHKAK